MEFPLKEQPRTFCSCNALPCLFHLPLVPPFPRARKFLQFLCVYAFVRIPGCLRAVRAIAWPPPWRWVVPPTIAALPATCPVPVTPPEAPLTGDRSPCLSSKEEGGEGLCLAVTVFVSEYLLIQIMIISDKYIRSNNPQKRLFAGLRLFLLLFH